MQEDEIKFNKVNDHIYHQPYYGAHVSIRDGIPDGIEYINNLGGNMIQIFISNPLSSRGTIVKTKYTDDRIVLIHEKLTSTDSKIVIHLPYVINLSKPLPENIKECKWINIICEHLVVSELIESIGCVIHVGKYLDLTQTDGLDNMYNRLIAVIDFMRERNMRTKIILETSSGQGTELLRTNGTLNDLAEFYNRFTSDQKRYIKLCVDTCHIFVAGYDIRGKRQVKQFFDEFSEKIGLEHMALIHLNDSKASCGSRLDRHENIGEGRIGLEGLDHIIRYGLYYRIPMILETPSNTVSEVIRINGIKNSL
jgi:deoxyribonuclease-4